MTNPTNLKSQCRFDLAHFREILEKGLAANYDFIFYDQLAGVSKDQRACLLRHDIDYTPERSIEMGDIEKSLGIRATYFFQICAKTYNVREAENYRVVRELKKMGHDIGLHVDLSWEENAGWDQVVSLCRGEEVLFEQMTGVKPCSVISFHNPHRFADRIVNQDIPNLRHTYEKAYFSEIKYLSDSQGWYEGCMCHIFESGKYPLIQLLTHPYIWPTQSSGDFIEDMANMVTQRSLELKDYLVKYHPVCKKNAERLEMLINKRLHIPS